MFDFVNLSKQDTREFDVLMLLQRELNFFLTMALLIDLCNKQDKPRASAEGLIEMWKVKMKESFDKDLKDYNKLRQYEADKGSFMPFESELEDAYEKGMKNLMEGLQPMFDKMKENKDADNN